MAQEQRQAGPDTGGHQVLAFAAQTSGQRCTFTAVQQDFAGRFGLTPAEIHGRGLDDLITTRPPERLRTLLAGLAEGRTTSFTEPVVGRDAAGGTFPAELTAVGVTGRGGPAGLVLLLSPSPAAQAPFPSDRTLSQLDARVLEGVADGASTMQLAASLYLSRQGIEYRVGLLLRRFGAPNRAALVGRAFAAGVFTAGQWPAQVLPSLIK